MDPFSAIMAGAGIAGNVIGALTKQSGVQQNNAAMQQIMADQLARIHDYDAQAAANAQWYNGATQGIWNNTLSGSLPGAQATDRASAEATRTNAGNAILDTATPAANYSDHVPDPTGATGKENARQLAKYMSLNRSRAAAGAQVNSYGDALLNTGINIGRGQQQQGFTNQVGQLRTRLNQETHVPVLSDQAKAQLAGNTGSGAFDTGNLIQAGGQVLGAAGSYGVPQSIWSGLFQGGVGADGKQQLPGLITDWLS